MTRTRKVAVGVLVDTIYTQRILWRHFTSTGDADELGRAETATLDALDAIAELLRR